MSKVIEIENFKYTTHSIELYKNGQLLRTDFKASKNKIIATIEEGTDDDIYELKVSNDCLKTRIRSLIYLIIMFFGLLSGIGDNFDESTPVGSIIKFSGIGDVKLKCLKLGSKEAFEVYGASSVLANKFVLEKVYYKRWIYASLMPIEIVALALVVLFCMVFKSYIAKIITVALFLMLEAWIVKYVMKIRRYV